MYVALSYTIKNWKMFLTSIILLGLWGNIMDNDFESHKERAKEYAREQRKRLTKKPKSIKSLCKKTKKSSAKKSFA